MYYTKAARMSERPLPNSLAERDHFLPPYAAVRPCRRRRRKEIWRTFALSSLRLGAVNWSPRSPHHRMFLGTFGEQESCLLVRFTIDNK